LTDGFTQAIRKSFEDAETGGAIILKNTDETQWMIADGQIIDDTLQGDFAVFSLKDGKLVLKAVYSFR
jgi:hypothetical protein